MLRRPPTTLTITAEDVAAYEDRRAAEAQHAEAQQRQPDAAARNQQQPAAAQSQQQQPDAAARQQQQASPRRDRDERIGVTRSVAH
ncbi:hypothetical protein G6O67_007501 [Ophiocordyceps sinensis]|uniref:Anaphase-promoting complex, subunit CDC26 n=1 Tax=Ophiocordyceps sinensis TaxID=72228 RepID=A0A8H4PJA6_9HYPO|nr:hypothetical protein G6O67_007501 [Ophiocordyceps sinensis]